MIATVGATDPPAGSSLLVRGGVLAHVVGAGVDPDGAVDDAVHDGVGVDPGAQALVPVLLRVLRAEDGGYAFEGSRLSLFSLGTATAEAIRRTAIR